jgi:FkbM family methyltransferase
MFMHMRSIQAIKNSINSVLSLANLRLVNAKWGPIGFAETFRKIRKAGVVPAQIVDVGASRGVWTLECMSVFPEASYFLVDPLEQNWPFLESLTRSRDSIKAWKGALGTNEGYLPMHIHGDQSSFLESEYSAIQEPCRIEVEIRPLDSFLGSMLKPPDLIKLDVQGFELEVLRGAERCMSNSEVILSEVSFYETYKGCPLAHEVISFLGERGFRIFDICAYVQRPYDGALFQSDIVFAKHDSVLFKHEGYR